MRPERDKSMMNKKVSVLAAGSWGTALAQVWADRGYEVSLWTRDEAQAAEINRIHRNEKYLPGFALSSHIKAVCSIQEAVEDAEAVLFACPTIAMRAVAALAKPWLRENTLVLHAAKGFESGTWLRMSEVLAAELPQVASDRIVVLSGPSHAEEVVIHCPTTIVAAANSLKESRRAQSMLMTSYFRVYTHSDVIGVEVAGALKNMIAIGGGLSDGLGYGDNAKAALITRGLAEITRLGTAMGANASTFAGLAGIGDIIVTCTSKHSRNWQAGYRIAQGASPEEATKQLGAVVEGIRTTKAAVTFAERYHVKMPVASALYEILYENKSAREATIELMQREGRHETDFQSIK